MIFLQPNFDGLISSAILMMFGPALVLAIIAGFLRYNKNRKAAKVLFVLAIIYLVISLGYYAVLMAS